jgi:hypothetical protein
MDAYHHRQPSLHIEDLIKKAACGTAGAFIHI